MFIIAEIAQAHEGSLGIAHSYIDALAGTGVDAVKFQTHIAEAESSSFEPFRVKFSYEDKTRFDYWKRMEFTLEEWAGLKTHCEEKGMEFISSPFSLAAVDLLEKLEVKKYKLGSGEVSNLLMLEKISSTGKDIILSSGMSSYAELDMAINSIAPFGNKVSLLQCTTAYPTVSGEWGLSLIPQLKERFKLPVGFSDHSGEIHPCIAATALGAEILEFHVVFDKRMFGPDARASLEINQVVSLVKSCHEIFNDLNTLQSKESSEAFSSLKKIFEKSLSVNQFLPVGHILSVSDLDAKKPAGYGIDARDYKRVIGRKLNKDMEANDFLNASDLD
ncbi:MAG: N-acetylneuraminate synthase family protein [Chitinophagaceae bacterium]|nr:N-acetylneuraminate synthase family protein [Chitinophagaceae bacterium]